VTDPLTGLLNRRGFDDRLREEIGRARRSGRPLAVVLSDCDDLKRVNDAHGHERGDAVLQAIASLLRNSKRASDVAGRLGGDEFGLVLTDADAAVAADVAERLRLRLHELSVLDAAPTASFGFAVYPDDGLTSAALLRVADQALYEAKRAGKDQLARPRVTVPAPVGPADLV
jgi:diguanylate cyclase (GGDEF)-like protein